MEEGYIGDDVAVLWIKHGFLVVFEGLLSVAGSERAMLGAFFVYVVSVCICCACDCIRIVCQ